MFSEEQIKNWFTEKRPMWVDVRVVIPKKSIMHPMTIAFIYCKMHSTDTERNIARIYLDNKSQLDELNPFEWIG
jgi:hypothetical protein